MSVTAADLTGGVYYVCEQCKEGKYQANLDEGDVVDLSNFISFHLPHGGTHLIIATAFLSKDLPNGYIDVDRPDLEPLILHIPGDDHTEKGGMQPGGAEGAAEIQRQMRKAPIQNGKPFLPPIPTVEEIKKHFDERPTFSARTPTIKDMQVTLPWSVKYSRDYRANPEAHKDFRHAITHIMKATGKLCGIVDDFDHRRASDWDYRAKDYLADLVICAMRAANTYPGGVIDLMEAVTNRVVSKNFTDVKVVEDPDPE